MRETYARCGDWLQRAPPKTKRFSDRFIVIGPNVNILLIPDSFKGSLSSARLCAILKAVAQEVMPDAQVTALPAADGGEGTLDMLRRAVGGAFVVHTVTGPCGQRVNARYLSAGDTAYIEMAEAAGLQHRLPGFNAANTTTFGVGQLCGEAINAGHRRLVLTMGGSCTADAGCGMAAALGARFIAPNGRPFIPTGDSLTAIRHMSLNPFFWNSGIQVEALCDVTNPLCGPNGTARQFAPQKGATPKEVEAIEAGMQHLAGIFASGNGPKIADMPCAGAAGGCAAGVHAFLNGKLLSGSAALLDLVKFTNLAAKADVIVTGEGCVENQTVGGKLVSAVAERAQGRPVIVLAGSIAPDTDMKALYEKGVTAVIPLTTRPMTTGEAMSETAAHVRQVAGDIFRLVKALKA